MKEELYFSTRDLSVGYRGVPLIKDIGIGIGKGEILTLIGPNGAGKTTILKSIIRQLDLIGGAVYIDGRDASAFSGNEFARQLSVVLTERVKPEMMTCGDVESTGRYPYTGKFGVLSKEDKRIVAESMDLVRVGNLKDRDFRQTSDGQKQRVMLARALCQEPSILVLDEPTSFLDIRYKLEFLSIIQKMSRERGLTVIMSLHEIDLAERISDKVACVKGDRIDCFGTPEEIFRGDYIKELYGMTVGTMDVRSGSAELEGVKGIPEVFVVAGCGTGTPVYRRLQREGTPFATGILWENDLDFPAACALASEVVSVGAYGPVTDEALSSAKKLVSSCGRVICTLDSEMMTGEAGCLKSLLGGAGQAL